MSEPKAPVTRQDQDILTDVHQVIIEYPPSASDQHQIHPLISGGRVVLTGHVQSPITRRWLSEKLVNVNGVTAVDVSQLFSEEEIRLEVGRVIPAGLQANVRYGTVVLSGKLPAEQTETTLVSRVATIPGVQRVMTDFR